MPIKLVCAYCGKEFVAINRKSRKQKYCSKECYHRAWEGPHPELYKIPDKICPQCGKKFHPKDASKKFCSRNCASTWNHNIEQRGEGLTRTVNCLLCGKQFFRKSKRNKFCSHDCYAKFHSAERNKRFNGYTTQDKRGYIQYTERHPEYPYQYVHNVIWRKNNPDCRCKLCGGDVECVHHINGKKSDNRLENLMGLCRSCHAQLHSFGNQ